MGKTTRILCLLLAMLMLQIPALGLPASAEEDAEAVNLLENPSFEEEADGWVAGWDRIEAEGCSVTLDSSKTHSGKNAVHVQSTATTGAASGAWAAQRVKGLQEGAMYELSVFMNVESEMGNGGGIKVEYYDKNGEYLPGTTGGTHSDIYPNGSRYITSTNNRWVEHITIFKIPEGAVTSKIYIRLYGSGHAWLDDVSLKFSGGPEPYKFDTERIFLYKETAEGAAAVKLDEYYLGSDIEKDTRVDFELVNNGEVCAKAEDVKFKDLVARFTYPTAVMTPYEPYTVNCRIKDKDGNLLEEHTRNTYVVDRPTVLDENGDFVIDGKKLNPVISYHAQVADFAKIKESGHNIVMISGISSSDKRPTIQALQENGLYAIIALYQYPYNAAHPEMIDDTRQAIEEWKDVPNVIGYAAQDEPFLAGDNPETREYNEKAYLLFREMDPDRAVILTDKRFESITAQYCDIFILDSYAGGENTTLVSEESTRARAATSDKNDFWELAATYFGNSMSTLNAARNSIYRAFEEGARGIGYYCFSDSMKDRPGYEENPQLYHWEGWDGFCKMNHEEVPILFDRFVNGNAIPFNEYDDGNGHHSMRWFDWFVGDDMYLVAHNRGREAQTVKIPLTSANGKISVGGFKAEPIGLTTQAELKGKNSIELTVASEEVVLYKITPDQKVDLSKIDEPAETEKEENPVEDGIFKDLAGYDWAKDAIESLYEDGIVNAKEEGIYAPGEAITRLDFVSALVRALELTEEGEAFPDCDATEIKIARAAGITNGDTDGNFRPYDTITRQDIMTTAVRALNAGLSEAEIPEFSDWSLVSDYALEAVQVMTQAGVIQGNGDGTLNPLGNATRAEAAVMLERMLGTEFTEKPDPSEIREEIAFEGAVDEATLAKWNNAKALTEGLGICAPEIEKSVTKGDFEAAISNILGTNYDAFLENNKALTYAEAVEALVKLLGYEAHAASRGGYMGMAAQLDLIKGLAPETYIRGGELCVLLENAIEIKMAERTGFGEEETYQESDDTLLSAYRNIYVYKGTVEGDYYTNTALKKGEILLDGEVFEGGEGFFKQRVIAYAEHLNDAKKIHYIKPANDTEVITVDRDEILEADTSKIRVDGNGDKDKIYSISGADFYINGEKKTPTNDDLRPDMGTVSIISSGGAVTAVLVEKYVNRVVESVYAEENTVYFKNGDDKDLVLDTDKDRFYMDFDLKSLEEWNVLSVMYRDEAKEKVYKVVVSSENVQGAPSETSTDGILLGETIYPVAKACFGTPVLGTEAVFYLDFQGKIAAVNDAGVTPEYGYLTAVAGGKGLAGGVSLRIFTKNNEMKVFRAADNIKLNGEPVTEDELIKEELAIDEDTGKQTGQLIVYELNEEEKITEIRTANKDAVGKTNYVIQKQFSPGSFILVNDNLDSDGGTYTSTHGFQMLGTLYRITTDTVTFNVPAVYSDNANDYKATMGGKAYTHGTNSGNVGSLVYDWHEDYTVGAVVRPAQVLSAVSNDSNPGVFLGLGEALDEDGMPMKMIRMLLPSIGQELQYYVDPDIKVDLGSSGIALSDVTNPNETEKTGNTLNADMPLNALNYGDVIQFVANGSEISAMRVLLRAESPKKGEYSSKVQKPKRLYGPLVMAYGEVQMVFDDGFSMTPVKDERMFLEIHSGGKCPAIIMDLENEKYKVLNMSGLREGDKVFVSRYNAYQTAIVAYR